MTPRELVDAVYAKAAEQGVPAPQRPSRRDTFKIGNPDAQITGIATTGMTTFDVFKRAVAKGINLLIPHEGTWFSDYDNTDFLEGDAIYQAKRAYAEEHGLIVWRNHDMAHRIRPDQMFAGQLRLLGWTADPLEAGAVPRMPVVTLPEPMTLEALSRYVVARTGTHSHRITGDPGMLVRRVAVGVGYAFPNFFAAPGIDVIVGGESAEGSDSTYPTFDLTAYGEDSTLLGRPRGMILLGHMGTEDIGMQVAAEWLRTFVSGFPIEYMPAGEPFGRPI
jgi:putative NIF3 family GTP cyclohydrolase 1 type 2